MSPPRVTRKKRISLSRSGLDALVSATGCIHSRIVAGTTGKTVITTRAACALAAAIARIERGLIPSPPVIREISPSPAPKPRPLKKTRPSKKPKRRQNESESDRQRRDDGPSAPSPAPPSPDKNELKSRLQALEATLQTKALENSALKRDNASLSQQVADMGTRLETLETALQGKREMVKSEKKQGRDRLRVHQEASYRAAAKKEVSAMHLKAMCYLSRSIDWLFHSCKTKFN